MLQHARHGRRWRSLQGGDVVVVDEHPFNPVVKELGVIAFLTWKRKILMSGCKVGAACHLKIEKRTAQIIDSIVSFVLSVQEPRHLLCNKTSLAC